MPPRKTTDYGALFESLIEDLRIQVAASVDRSMRDLTRRISRIERRLDQLDPENAVAEEAPAARACSLCERVSVARGLCSAHYQQWRYRERKAKTAREHNEQHAADQSTPKTGKSEVGVPEPLRLSPNPRELSTDN
jgi:hypothetical protein